MLYIYIYYLFLCAFVCIAYLDVCCGPASEVFGKYGGLDKAPRQGGLHRTGVLIVASNY